MALADRLDRLDNVQELVRYEVGPSVDRAHRLWDGWGRVLPGRPHVGLIPRPRLLSQVRGVAPLERVADRVGRLGGVEDHHRRRRVDARSALRVEHDRLGEDPAVVAAGEARLDAVGATEAHRPIRSASTRVSSQHVGKSFQ